MYGIVKVDLKEVIGIIVCNMGLILVVCGDINCNVMVLLVFFEKGGYFVVWCLVDEIVDLFSFEVVEGVYFDFWVDGDLSYCFKFS